MQRSTRLQFCMQRACGLVGEYIPHTSQKYIRQCDMNQEKKKTMSSTGEAQPEPGKFTEATLLLEA